jgi:hypothetical protein
MSAIAGAIESMLVAQADPNRQVVKDGMAAFVNQMKSETQDRQLETISKAAKLLANAVETQASQSVIDAYERILAKASA